MPKAFDQSSVLNSGTVEVCLPHALSAQSPRPRIHRGQRGASEQAAAVTEVGGGGRRAPACAPSRPSPRAPAAGVCLGAHGHSPRRAERTAEPTAGRQRGRGATPPLQGLPPLLRVPGVQPPPHQGPGEHVQTVRCRKGWLHRPDGAEAGDGEAGGPQTHLGLKRMIKEVPGDFDGKLSFRELLLIFHKAAAGELREDSGLMALAKLSEIDVALEGVKGAKDFFEAKVQALSSASKSEAELKEQDEWKRAEDKRKLHQAAFRELKATFST
ncbi:hypothetical protein DBR06_SOUSAS1010217 [Sousa chinensis]|nr:hypothetical protein DBR06_SOUSAS1010217 [Sousa chinensis]